MLLVDFDYFFAQCEILRNPNLKEKPVVIGVYSGRTEDSGAVSTANYVARENGVESGIPLYLAKKRLEGTEAVFLPVDYAFYKQVSDSVLKTLRLYADIFERVGIDEAYLDVTERVQESFHEAKKLAQEIKKVVKKQHGLTVSVGVGPNKLIAKIACGIKKPNGLKVVKPEDIASFLGPLPVSRLIGIGRKTTARMDSMGIKTINDLANFNVQRLIEVFGKTLGAYFHNSANGIDNEPVEEAGEAESISKIATLKENTRDLAPILKKTRQLAKSVHMELLQRKSSFKQVGIIAIMGDMSVHSRLHTLEKPENSLEVLEKNVLRLFEKLLSETSLDIRRVGVKISGFTRQDNRQTHLSSFFNETSPK